MNKEAKSDQSDNILIRAFQRGDAASFRDLYARHKDPAFFYALNLTRNRYRAEEVVQDAFLGFLKNVQDFVVSGSFRRYLFAAVRSRAIDERRRRKTRREEPFREEIELFEPRNGQSDPGQAAELRSQVTRALLALPGEQREAVVLKIYEGMTFREIAALVDASENTVASRYRYGIDKLRIRLQRAAGI